MAISPCSDGYFYFFTMLRNSLSPFSPLVVGTPILSSPSFVLGNSTISLRRDYIFFPNVIKDFLSRRIPLPFSFLFFSRQPSGITAPGLCSQYFCGGNGKRSPFFFLFRVPSSRTLGFLFSFSLGQPAFFSSGVEIFFFLHAQPALFFPFFRAPALEDVPSPLSFPLSPDEL